MIGRTVSRQFWKLHIHRDLTKIGPRLMCDRFLMQSAIQIKSTAHFKGEKNIIHWFLLSLNSAATDGAKCTEAGVDTGDNETFTYFYFQLLLVFCRLKLQISLRHFVIFPTGKVTHFMFSPPLPPLISIIGHSCPRTLPRPKRRSQNRNR